MALAITCPGCSTPLNVAESLIGKTIKCKTCGEMIAVTAPAPIRATVAKAAPARVAAVADDDDDDLRPTPKSARRTVRDDDQDERDAPVKSGGSKLPLILAGVAVLMLVVVGGGAFAAWKYLAASTDDASKQIAGNNTPPPVDRNMSVKAVTDGDPVTEPAKKDEPKKDDVTKTEEPKSEPAKKEEAKKDEPKSEPVKKDEPKTVKPDDKTAKAPTTPASPPAGTPPEGQTSQEWYRKMMAGEMDDLTREQSKKATVFVQVESKFGGGGTGSGWFGIEPNIVITNAHVIDMIAPNSPPPAKITIYINSGEKGQTPGVLQREIPHQKIKILAVDRDHDIAILEILNEKDLPVPFKVRPTAQLRERQGITILGFPLGYTPGRATGIGKDEKPSVSVRISSVAAKRYDEFGILRNLQVESGISPGNSGGPEVDAEGYVIGMTVAVLTRDNRIGLAVPTEHILGLLAGRIDTVTTDTAFNKDGMVHIPIRITAQDPLKRLKKVGVGVWVGDSSGKIRPPGEVRAGMQPSDKDYKEVELKYDFNKKEALGTLVLPPLTPGLAYWIQPYYANTIVPKYYLPGIKQDLKGPPVDLAPATLTANIRPGPVRPFTLFRSNAQDEFAEGESRTLETLIKFQTTLKGTETVLGPDPADRLNAARLRLKYDDADMKVSLQNEEQPMFPPRNMLQLKEGIKKLEAYAYVNKDGGIYKTRTNSLAVTEPIVRVFGPAMSNDALDSLTRCSITMPGRQVSPGEEWGYSRNGGISLSFLDTIIGNIQGPRGPQPPGRPRPGGPGNADGEGGTSTVEVARRDFTFVEEVKFTYQGVRTRAGRQEAVVRLNSKIVASAGKPRESAGGSAKGYVFVDVASGIVIEADIESEFELDTSIQGLKKRLYSMNTYKLTRGANVK